MTYNLPEAALNAIESYWNLKAAENKYIRCPYFRNPKSGRERWGLTAYSGKGSARDIEDELKIIEKLEGKDFSKMHESEIRDIMRKRKLGIECSGFITRILDAWTREFYKKPIYSLIKFNSRGLGRLFCKMRPYTHIDLPTLAHPSNARGLENINDIMPGDIIRFNSIIDHAVLITKTVRDTNLDLKKICYAHSVLEDNGEGIKSGTIEIASKFDLNTHWREEPETGHTINEKGDPKFYRLFILEPLWQSK